MLTFAHLSDIHFRNRDQTGAPLHGTQFDLDRQLRSALLDDLQSKPAGAKYDGLLVTGDVAFAGIHEDYEIAQEFLNELFQRCEIAPKHAYFVPGNHDVDRSYTKPKLPLWDSHVKIRAAGGQAGWNDIIDTQLHRDPAKLLLKPFEAYNNFAQGYGCATLADPLAWTRLFPDVLEDGTKLRLHGLNSALVSDEADEPGKLLITDFQTAHFEHAKDTIDVVMCHHPPEWLLDKGPMNEKMHSFAEVGLFGHEHSTRIVGEAMLVQLYAGAVQPSRRDPGWLPTYHILQLSIDTSAGRHLVVTIHTREFSKDGHVFRARRTRDDKAVDVYRIELPVWKASEQKQPASTVATDAASVKVVATMTAAAPNQPSPADDAERELLVYFFRLGAPGRYAVAVELGLIRDGDDALDPRAMWAEIFRRAIDESKMPQFWRAVAARLPEMSSRPNPF